MSRARRAAATACGAAFALVAAHAAAAQDEPGVLGDWGGTRSRLKDQGLTFDAEDRFEAAGVVAGDGRKLSTGANEIRFGATADLGKIWGLTGGKAAVVFTRRSGSSLAPSTGLDPLMPFIEIHGRGDIWRLTHLWYAQDLPAGLNLKLGRMDPGGDFDAFSCDFENLTFCGAPPGNVVGDYWYNWPVGQWGVRLKWASDAAYVQAGAYHVKPDNLTDGFDLSFEGGKGTLVPFELGWTPKLGQAGLPGAWLIGGWWTDVEASELPTAATPARLRGHQWGEYASIRQQVSGTPDGKGLSLFANYMHADKETSRLDRQFAVGVSYRGALPGRDKDEVALAFGGTHVNDRVSAASGAPRPHTEYVTELDYRLHALPGVLLTPNLQYVEHAGGIAGRHATVLGLKSVIRF